MKALFLSLPSVSVTNTAKGLVEKIANEGCEIIHYNTLDFQNTYSDKIARFKDYQNYSGYNPANLPSNITLFEFGLVLIRTASSILDFLLKEVEREKPDFIMHSHLAVWGKILANYFQIPAVSLASTFILDPKIMNSSYQKLNNANNNTLQNIIQGKRLNDEVKEIEKKYNLSNLDSTDILVNKARLNLVFILKQFQPRADLLGEEFKFIGSPFIKNIKNYTNEVVYVSLGSVFNEDLDFYKLCIGVLSSLNLQSIIVVGNKIKSEELGHVGSNIQIVSFADQVAALQRASVFITHCGMASVHESIFSRTPMIAIPTIAEQQLTAETIQDLGIGIHLSRNSFSAEKLQVAILDLIINPVYIKNIESLISSSNVDPDIEGVKYIRNYIGF